MSDAPAVFTPAEVAERVGASESYVRQLCREGRVEHLRVGRKAPRFTPDQLVSLIEYLTKTPTAADESALTTARSRARSRS